MPIIFNFNKIPNLEVNIVCTPEDQQINITKLLKENNNIKSLSVIIISQ